MSAPAAHASLLAPAQGRRCESAVPRDVFDSLRLLGRFVVSDFVFCFSGSRAAELSVPARGLRTRASPDAGPSAAGSIARRRISARSLESRGVASSRRSSRRVRLDTCCRARRKLQAFRQLPRGDASVGRWHSQAGTDLNLGASFDRESSATGSGRTVSAELSAYRHSAQHAVKCAEEPPTRIVSWQSQVADGPTRRSNSVSRGVLDGATATHSPQTTSEAATGWTRLCQDEAPHGKSACGAWIRAWGQREPAGQGTGRTALHHGSATGRGWTSPSCTPIAAHYNGNTRSGRRCALLGHALGKSKNVN